MQLPKFKQAIEVHNDAGDMAIREVFCSMKENCDFMFIQKKNDTQNNYAVTEKEFLVTAEMQKNKYSILCGNNISLNIS